MQHTVYVLYSDLWDKYYIGQTDNITSRLIRHNSGFVKSTAPYRPWILKCLIMKENRSDAVILEKKLKNLNRERLEIFIQKYGLT